MADNVQFLMSRDVLQAPDAPSWPTLSLFLVGLKKKNAL